MEKILRIEMGAQGGPAIRVEPLGEYAGLGGRAMTSAVVAREVPPTCHALGAENKLVIAPGLLSGSAAVISGRLSVGCKSPLTGTIKEANSGGQAAIYLARHGYAAVILEGSNNGKDLYKIHIGSKGVSAKVDNSLRMLTNYDLVEKMKAEYGEKIVCISIGPAGEMKLGAATIGITDMETRPSRHAARGGVGAVMGAKGVKVIVIETTETQSRQPKEAEKFKVANRKFSEGLRAHAVTGQALPKYGTNVLTNILCEAGGYPTYNFKDGVFKEGTRISGETFAEIESQRGGQTTHGCHSGCIIQCSGTYVDKDGKFISKQPEYETVWAHGGNCGISDPDAIARMDFLDDTYGIDTIEMGATIAVAMEAGVIPFGDAQGAIKLIEEVGQGTPLGRILGSGAEVTGRAFGVERVPVVKGQAMPAYDPRTVQGIGVTYATSPMGADHTAGYAVATNILKVGGFVDPLKPLGQVELSRNLQIATAAIDSTGLCLFIAFAILDQPETFQAMLDMINAFHGLSLSADDVTALGKKILSMERDFNTRAGFTAQHDRLPRFFYTEKVAPHNLTWTMKDEELDQVFNW